MWTNPALARALRMQGIAHRKRNYTFTPAPLPRSYNIGRSFEVIIDEEVADIVDYLTPQERGQIIKQGLGLKRSKERE